MKNLKQCQWTFRIVHSSLFFLTLWLIFFFTHAWFGNILHWSFRKYWFIELCRPSKYLHISLYNIKKEHFLSYHWPHQKYLLVAGGCQVHDGTHKPSTILIFTLEAHILSLATHTANCFPQSDRLTLFAFEKMSARYPHLNNHQVSVGCSFYVKKKKKKRHLVKIGNFSSQCKCSQENLSSNSRHSCVTL